jgi:predicted membrane-bound spermidine synthase
MLQIIQTRILSVVAWYHLAFFAISMAMFGMTAGAVWIYLRQDRFTEKTLSSDLAYFSTIFAATTCLCLLVQMTLPLTITLSATTVLTWVELSLLMSVPFFFAGIVITLALTRSPFPIGRVYAADLAGAAVGCLGVLLLLNLTDGPSAVLWVGAAGAAAAWLFSGSGIGVEPVPRPVFYSVFQYRRTLLIALAIFATLNGRTDFSVQPLIAKGRFEGGNSHIFREWNSFSRIAVYPTKIERPFYWGPSPLAPKTLGVEQRLMNIDGDAATTAYYFNGDLKAYEFLKYDITNLAYHLAGRRNAAIIGVGSGRDVLSAAVFGIRDIKGIELNPIFIRLLTSEPGFADFANLNQLDGVEFIVNEARNWFAQTLDTFDIIEMSLIDTWAATGAGAFSLSENGLYTVEGWNVFLRRLTRDGVFTVSRWHDPENPVETGRLLSLAVAALLEMGVAEPNRHLFLATQGRIATLIVSRAPLSPKDQTQLINAATRYQHTVLASPRITPESEVLRSIVSKTNRRELDDYTSGLAFDLTPATDDRPFFFNQMPLSKPLQAFDFARTQIGLDPGKGGVRSGNMVATATLIILFLVSLALVVTTILVPLRTAIRDVGAGLATTGSCYFLLIGVGFMLVEISLLQRMSVFLGHPIYSLSILLFTLILATGLGSLLSEIIPLNNRLKFGAWALLTSAYILALPLWLADLMLDFDYATLLVRAAICIAAIAPAGLLMGFAFPTGMRLVSTRNYKPTAWFWGINGAAGVLAATIAVGTSIAFGISTTLSAGGICYLLLIPAGLLLLRSAPASHAA